MKRNHFSGELASRNHLAPPYFTFMVKGGLDKSGQVNTVNITRCDQVCKFYVQPC